MKRNKAESEEMFKSFLWTRFIAALLLIAIGIADFVLLGFYIGNPDEPIIGIYIGHGTAFFLGGLSFFYPVGFPALVIGFILLLYVIISKFHGRFEIHEGKLIISEKRLIRKQIHTISEPEIEGIRYQNTNLGPRFLWYAVFIPMILMILQWGVPLFGEARMEDQILPTMMLLTAIIDGISLFLLVVHLPHYTEIATGDRYYEALFNPIFNKGSRNFNETSEHNSNETNNDRIIAHDLGLLNGEADSQIKQFEISKSQYFQLVVGIILLSVSIVSASFEILFGTLFWMMGAIYGTILIVKALHSDFNTESNCTYNETINSFQQYRRLNFNSKVLNTLIKPKFEYISILKVKNVTEIEKPRKIGFVELFAINWLVVTGSQQVTYSWLLLNPSSPAVLVDVISTTVIFVVIIFILFMYLALNIPQLDIESATFHYNRELPNATNLFFPLKVAKIAIKNTLHSKETMKIFWMRTIILMVFVLLGIVSAVTSLI
jgi:hypothetical protein